ncbi:MAG: SPFH domain-containing protein [Lentisphaeria bacterium]|nr:SPFH domain-containing protein [Lentisphaeria bacterium]
MGNQLVRSERLAWAVFGGGLVLTAVSAALSLAAKSLSLTPVMLGNCLFTAVALLTAVRYRLARREEAEALNLRIYREEHPGSELFEDSDEALKMASRAFKTYEKGAMPVLAICAGAGVLAAGILVWRNWSGMPTLPVLVNPGRYGILTGVLFVVTFLAGSFCVGASRDEGGRWLRPPGAWLFFTGTLWLLATIALFIAASSLTWPRIDRQLGIAALIALLALAAELMIGVIIEFYRPRRVNEEERPIIESRLLALLTEPGGIARNVAAALDYQFGFKISERAFYGFIQRSLLPLGLLLCGALWLSTCFAVVDTEENGIREWFGNVTNKEPLPPGLYAKLPWPFGKIYTFPVQRVQTLAVGYAETDDNEASGGSESAPDDMGDLTGRVIIWDKAHTKEEVNFVVASRPDQTYADTFASAVQERIPVSTYFLSVSMPLFFKVNNLFDYAYRHADPNQALMELAHEELTRYCAQVDFYDLLTKKRHEAGRVISQRVQERADALRLGVEIVFFGLHGVHPPVKVGGAFNEVVSASEEMHTIILRAETDAVSAVARAEGDAATILSEAASYTYDRRQVANAEADRFAQQLTAYHASPALFPLHSFLDVLETETADRRKYIVTVKGGRETIVLNLEEKARTDLLDINLERED